MARTRLVLSSLLSLLVPAFPVLASSTDACLGNLEPRDEAAAASQASSYHDYLLLSAQAEFDPNAAWSAFYSGSQAIYTKLKPRKGKEFVASNEFDWWRMELDQEPTDVVIGFGTNNAWDIAVRKDAGTLLIGDWRAEPILAHRYLFEPLFKVAASPNDFLSLLAGVPLPKALESAPLSDAFDHINRYLELYQQLKINRIDRHAFLKEAFGRFTALGTFSDNDLQAIGTYYSELLNHHLRWRGFFGPILGWVSAPQNLGVSPLWRFFDKRYNPKALIGNGASPEQVQSPFFSFLSSPQAFGRIKHLMDGHVYYVVASYDDLGIYEAAKKLGQGERYTISLTNILDLMHVGDEPSNVRSLDSFLRQTAGILATDHAPLHVVRSRSSPDTPGFGFEKFVLRSPADASTEISRNVKLWPPSD